MSKQTPQQPPLTPEQENQQLFHRLSVEYKKPIRDILGEAQEAVQNTISNMIQQLIQLNNALKKSNQEITHLQKICTDNKIPFTPRPQNRAERREEKRKQSKKS